MDRYRRSDNRRKGGRPSRSYPLAKHHAWGGLALLSLLGVARILFPELPDVIWVPLASLLVVYVLVWLFLTYRYRNNLKSENLLTPVGGAGGGVSAGEYKSRAKLEKKKIKAGIKEVKKSTAAGR